MRLRLGGKGYAPDSGHPLGQHVKGIGEFVSLMHRMETVLEEDPDIRYDNGIIPRYGFVTSLVLQQATVKKKNTLEYSLTL